MISEAEKKAKKKYRSEKMKQVVVAFSPAEAELYDYLVTKGNKAGFIKQLLRESMEGQA